VNRREFIAVVGGAAAWPLAASAQQVGMPVVGYLNASVADGYADDLRTFRQGLKESGYIESENVAIEYRWGENQPDRLAAMAADLVRRQVNVIAAASAPASVAAAKATTTTPIVFLVPEDPVRLGLVTSLSRPGGNATGINFFAAELATKRLEADAQPLAERHRRHQDSLQRFMGFARSACASVADGNRMVMR
jgi:putative ABC transport system substrate-binding protein